MANQAKFAEVNFSVGDSVRVSSKIYEEGKERVVHFDGIVIAIRGSKENKSFTVRKTGISGIGIERIFPLASPNLTKIEVKKRGKVRRAKLYYLRKQK